MVALVLSPCCWPRRREFTRGDSDELRELARLMCLKASTVDTYASWTHHLWGKLAAAATTLDDDGDDETRMVIGTHRDRDILSEKNITLLALKKDRRSCNAAVHAHKRYVASAQVGAWSRYAALREVYGLPVERMDTQGGRDEPGARPHPPLLGNVKPLHSLLSSRDHSEDGLRRSSQTSDKIKSGDSSKEEERRRQQTAADDAILDHVVSDAPLRIVFGFVCEPDCDQFGRGRQALGWCDCDRRCNCCVMSTIEYLQFHFPVLLILPSATATAAFYELEL